MVSGELNKYTSPQWLSTLEPVIHFTSMTKYPWARDTVMWADSFVGFERNALTETLCCGYYKTIYKTKRLARNDQMARKRNPAAQALYLFLFTSVFLFCLRFAFFVCVFVLNLFFIYVFFFYLCFLFLFFFAFSLFYTRCPFLFAVSF